MRGADARNGATETHDVSAETGKEERISYPFATPSVEAGERTLDRVSRKLKDYSGVGGVLVQPELGSLGAGADDHVVV